MDISTMTPDDLAKYLNENEGRVQELLSAFTLEDLMEHITRRIRSKRNG